MRIDKGKITVILEEHEARAIQTLIGGSTALERAEAYDSFTGTAPYHGEREDYEELLTDLYDKLDVEFDDA